MKRLPKYQIVDEIARGGMGVVQLALRVDVTTAEPIPVAIKHLHAHLVDNPEIVKAFIDEARIASRIVHPNVVTVLDVDTLGEELAIVMDYVEGIALRDLVRQTEGGLPVPVVRRILVDALNGLHAAHELTDETGHPLGVVHRDVSPHNLLVGVNGVTRVADFGIALAGGHTERAVLNVRLSGPLLPFSRIPLVSPAVGGAQVFVHHPRITSRLRKHLAQFLSLQTDIAGGAIDPEELHIEMERLGAVQLGRTLVELAKGLPIYDVVFHGEERVDVRPTGIVGE